MITTPRELSTLWLIYSAGVVAVYGLFALLYRYAYSQRRELELNEYESLCTRNAIIRFFWVCQHRNSCCHFRADFARRLCRLCRLFVFA